MASSVLNTDDKRYPELDIATCDLVGVFRINGGKLIVHRLPEWPPLTCSWSRTSTCEELADYVITLVPYSGDSYLNHLCELHYQFSQKYIFPLPIEVVH